MVLGRLRYFLSVLSSCISLFLILHHTQTEFSFPDGHLQFPTNDSQLTPPNDLNQAPVNHCVNQCLAPGSTPSASDSRKTKAENQDSEQPYIKRPENAFWIFVRENRQSVVDQQNIKNNAIVNKILGEKWRSLTPEQQEPYFEEAHKRKKVHQEQYPNWSPKDNHGKKRKRQRVKAAPSDKASAAQPDEPPQQTKKTPLPIEAGFRSASTTELAVPPEQIQFPISENALLRSLTTVLTNVSCDEMQQDDLEFLRQNQLNQAPVMGPNLLFSRNMGNIRSGSMFGLLHPPAQDQINQAPMMEHWSLRSEPTHPHFNMELVSTSLLHNPLTQTPLMESLHEPLQDLDNSDLLPLIPLDQLKKVTTDTDREDLELLRQIHEPTPENHSTIHAESCPLPAEFSQPHMSNSNHSPTFENEASSLYFVTPAAPLQPVAEEPTPLCDEEMVQIPQDQTLTMELSHLPSQESNSLPSSPLYHDEVLELLGIPQMAVRPSPPIFRLSGSGSRGQQLQEGGPDGPLPSRGGAPRPGEIYDPSTLSWVGPEVSSRRGMYGTPLTGGVRKAS